MTLVSLVAPSDVSISTRLLQHNLVVVDSLQYFHSFILRLSFARPTKYQYQYKYIRTRIRPLFRVTSNKYTRVYITYQVKHVLQSHRRRGCYRCFLARSVYVLAFSQFPPVMLY